MYKLFIGGFPRDLEEDELQEIVEEYGAVTSVKIIRDKKTGISRRYGFVEMATREDASRVIQMLNEGTIDGEVLGVKEAVVPVRNKGERKRLPLRGAKKRFTRISFKK